MRCIWKSMKACGGAAVRAGLHAASLPCPPRPHLLQHRLLREVEFLEPVILVVAGGVQVVRVHLGRGGQGSGPAGPPGKPGAGWGCGAEVGAGLGGGGPAQETHQVYRVLFVGLRQGARHEGLPALPLLLRQLCRKGRCNVRTEAPPTPPAPRHAPPSPFRSCCSCSALGPFSEFCTRALATLVKWPM